MVTVAGIPDKMNPVCSLNTQTVTVALPLTVYPLHEERTNV
jgi:hypothetical protein